MDKKKQVREIMRRFKVAYRQTGPFVTWSTPLELLIGTILSAQCTDVRVNMVTQRLFKKYRTAADYATARIATLEKEIYSTGFYRSKARALKESGRLLVEQFNGDVPNELADLLRLRGVSTKTAYIVLSKVYDKHVGVAVDTHVFRVTRRIGLSHARTPDKMSVELSAIIAPRYYLLWNEYLITHGRAQCGRKPKCVQCPIIDLCETGKKIKL